MNKLTIIGNLTKDPELRTTTSGKNVCTFSVAVNKRKKTQCEQEADFFRVSAWDQLGENCQKYLVKGKKVAVVGSVSVHAFSNSKNEPSATMEVLAQEVEFLTSRQDNIDQQSGMEKVNPAGNTFDNELPY